MDSVDPVLSRRAHRGLTPGEMKILKGLGLWTQAELDAVQIRSGGQFPGIRGMEWDGVAATTWSATDLAVNRNFALLDFSTNPDTMDLLVHEMYHVMQYNNSNVGQYRLWIGDQAERLLGGNTYTYTAADLARAMTPRSEE